MPYVNIGQQQTDVWPPDDEQSKQRLENYKRSRLLFKGQHEEVYHRIQRWLEESESKWVVYIVCNFAGLISKVSADMLFGERVKYVSGQEPGGPEQAQIDELVTRSKLHSLNYEMALSGSWRGEVIYKMRFGPGQAWAEDKNHAVIEPASPARFWPILSGDNVRNLQGGIFGQVRRDQDGKHYLKIERHEPGRIGHELYRLEGDGRTILGREKLNLFPDYKDLPEQEETGYPGLLFTFTPNWRLEDEFWGISDYYDLETIFDELNNRISRISSVLDKHESPRLVLPPGIMKWDERTQRWFIEKEDLEVLEISGQDDTVRGDLPKYLTWDAELNAAFKQVDKLIEMAFLISETSPDAFGMGERGGTESGRALKYRLLRLLAKINRKKLYFDEALKEALLTAAHLEATHGDGIDPSRLEGLRLEWGDGIPADEFEQAQVENLRTDGKPTTSIRSAVRRLDDLEGEALEQELDQIAQDATGADIGADEGAIDRSRVLDLFGTGEATADEPGGAE